MSRTKVVKVVIAQASFIAALMFYLGVIYTSAYYGHFHLSPFLLGFSFAEFVLQSLNLLTFPVLVGAVVLLIAVALSGPRSRQALPGALVRGVSLSTSALGRQHLLVVAAGTVLLILWWQWQLLLPYRWAGPLLIAFGLLLGVASGDGADRPSGLRDTAVPIFAAGVFLFWTVTLLAGQLGEQHAEHDGRNVVQRTGLVVFSAERLGLSSRSTDLHFKDLGAAVHLRYRYTGLRLIAARDGRYYAVPIGWRARTDPVYILRESDDVRLELTPGVQ
ncbi:hypothetical protein [Streptomyces sp. LUP47B]|uniref:hypothetical protein n=1 Tax=Streptomyces sp. LUP47B TaxID=1890286 RepID=UPI00099FB3E5|nr:hypothetical protein [Streptomyces sp. LUP47B]